MKNIIEISKTHSIEAHKAVNHLYNGKPYGETHLQMAVNIGVRFIHLIPEKDRNNVIGGIWEHDTIEDCGLTVNDVKNATNEIVAELAYACTNEKGRTRAERANKKYYRGIKRTKYAKFVKLCDRIANVKYSLDTNNRMFKMYQKEQKHFQKSLKDNIFDKCYKFFHFRKESDYKEMFDYLNELIVK
jgi:(p)ppGpp synthase/HD superfamily hydrolase